MKLFYISQTEAQGYDTYSDAVVAAETIEDARRIHPNGHKDIPDSEPENRESYPDWASWTGTVNAQEIGTAIQGTKRGLICASFHAG